MFQNDQVFSGEIGLLVLTGVPILVAALVGLVLRRDNAINPEAGSVDLLDKYDTASVRFVREASPIARHLPKAERVP